MNRSKCAVFVKNFSSKTARKPSIYKGLSHFCVIITRASILRTIPVAFIIYKISLLYKFLLLVSVNTRDLYCESLLFDLCNRFEHIKCHFIFARFVFKGAKLFITFRLFSKTSLLAVWFSDKVKTVNAKLGSLFRL